MQKITLLVGTPGSGKTWCMNQLSEQYHLMPHDKIDENGNYYRFTMEEYVRDIDNAAHTATKPVLCETPFSVSQILKPLEARGHKVTPVFIVERPDVTAQRYYQREGVAIPKGHLTRIETYRLRAREMKAKSGTSQEILLHLKGQQ